MTITRGAVVIPAYGKTELTTAVVAQCREEAGIVDVVVVDNAGDLPDVDGATILRPGRNLGWLGGTNLGMAWARGRGYDWLVALNNDVTLCTGFFAGMRAALTARPRDLVACCYDDHIATQNDYYRGPVDGFVPQDVEQRVSVIDGTAYALTSELFTAVGELDGKHFGRRGWGGIEDYILRVRALGGDCVVTRRAYLTHARGSTAHAVSGSYERYAMPEMRRGMRRKHGADWRQHFPTMAGPTDSPRRRLGDLTRAVEHRLGLTETAIGRR